MVPAIGKRDVTFLRQQHFRAAVFIDHIPAIVRRPGRSSDVADRAELHPVRTVDMGDGTAVNKPYRVRQI